MWHTMRSFVDAISSFVQNKETTPPEVVTDRERDSGRSIRVVALLASENDRSVIFDVCQLNRWEVFFAETVEDVREKVSQVEPQVALFDRDVAGESWRAAMLSLASSSTGACIMLVSSVTDGYLWNEVVCNGGYDVLSKPLRADEVCRIVKLARSYWISALKSAGTTRK
jgi:DNA-binding NtrC family response regulator